MDLAEKEIPNDFAVSIALWDMYEYAVCSQG